LIIVGPDGVIRIHIRGLVLYHAFLAGCGGVRSAGWGKQRKR
jgi:hypothetical protein